MAKDVIDNATDWFASNAPPATGGSFGLADAVKKVEAATGRRLTDQEIDGLLAKFGGNRQSTFTEEGLKPVIASIGAGSLGPNYGDLSGRPPDTYASNPNAPRYDPIETPETLRQPYVPPTWQGGDFVEPAKPAVLREAYRLPTQAELEASPGYQTRLTAGTRARNMSAAAQGTVLNGGTQKALERYGQDYASDEYSNFAGQTLGARMQNVSEFEGDATRAFSNYQNRYGRFQDAAAMGLSGRLQNLGELATARSENQNTFNNRYKVFQDENARTLNDYKTNVDTRRTANEDYWKRLKDLYDGGRMAASGSYQFSAI